MYKITNIKLFYQKNIMLVDNIFFYIITEHINKVYFNI